MLRRKQAMTVNGRRQQALECFSHGVTHLAVVFPHDEAVCIVASVAVYLNDDKEMAGLAHRARSTGR